jgi:hypothetical protein
MDYVFWQLGVSRSAHSARKNHGFYTPGFLPSQTESLSPSRFGVKIPRPVDALKNKMRKQFLRHESSEILFELSVVAYFAASFSRC